MTNGALGSRRTRGLLVAASIMAGLVLMTLRGAGASVQAPVNLGTATPFAVLGGQTVTNTGATVVNGDLGVSPGTAVTGFPPGTRNGTLHAADAVAAQAQADLTIAYNDAAGRAPDANLTGQDLGGLTLNAGVYRFDAASQLTGTVTLDGQGDPNAVFIIQIGSTLTTATNSTVRVINGAQSCHAYWQIGSSATLGTTTTFLGNVLALTSITAVTGTTVDGRLLARNGAVTLDTNVITPSTCAALPTTTSSTVGGGGTSTTTAGSGATTTTAPAGGGATTTTAAAGGGATTTTAAAGGGATTTTALGGGGTTTTAAGGGGATTTTTAGGGATTTTSAAGGATTTTAVGGGGSTTTTSIVTPLQQTTTTAAPSSTTTTTAPSSTTTTVLSSSTTTAAQSSSTTTTAVSSTTTTLGAMLVPGATTVVATVVVPTSPGTTTPTVSGPGPAGSSSAALPRTGGRSPLIGLALACLLLAAGFALRTASDGPRPDRNTHRR